MSLWPCSRSSRSRTDLSLSSSDCFKSATLLSASVTCVCPRSGGLAFSPKFFACFDSIFLLGEHGAKGGLVAADVEGSLLRFLRRFFRMNKSQMRFVLGAYSSQIPGISGVLLVSTGFPVYTSARICLYVSLNRISSSSRPIASKICFLSRSDEAMSTIWWESSLARSSARERE